MENRRRLENEGFQTDIKALKRRIKDVDTFTASKRSQSRVATQSSGKKGKTGSIIREETDEEPEEDEESQDDDDAATVDSEELDLIKVISSVMILIF